MRAELSLLKTTIKHVLYKFPSDFIQVFIPKFVQKKEQPHYTVGFSYFPKFSF